MERTKLTTFGSVVAATVASLCCIGPVVVAVVGVGSIGAFAAFETYRLPLIGVTLLLLGLAFYLVYRKREVMCEDGTCKIERASKWNITAVWFAAILAAVAIAFPYFDLTNAEAAETMIEQGSRFPHLAVTVLDIEGMDCLGCAKGLEATLARVKGVEKVAVEFEKQRAVVEHTLTMITPEQLVTSVAETGFTANVSSTTSSK